MQRALWTVTGRWGDVASGVVSGFWRGVFSPGFGPQLGRAQGICGWNACFCSLINSRVSQWNVREAAFRPHEFAPVFDVKGACLAGFQMRVQGLRFEGADGAPGSSVPSRLLMGSAAPGPAGLPFSLMFPPPLSSPGGRAGSSCQVSGRPLQWMPPGGVRGRWPGAGFARCG